jgi:protein O-GlcNAc transferase
MNQTLNSSTPPWQGLLTQAHAQAQAADFKSMQNTCASIAHNHGDDALALLDVGVVLLNFGFVSDATQCFERVTSLIPNDFRAKLNLANCARDRGDHARANGLYAELQAQLPDNPMVRRNVLISQQYNPAVSDAQRLSHARAWGEWATGQAGGARARPPCRRIDAQDTSTFKPLRVGYVSADLCQHTVGLFVKDVLKAHQRHLLRGDAAHRVEVFAYACGQVRDWVTQEIESSCTLRSVTALNDAELAQLIREDQIDVLVDLSGHTAGSRLTVFAHRPAPVQLSWLGYFATTGLPYVDAVLLDEQHAPEGAEDQFVERVVRLQGGRLCYQPVPWAPAVAPPPCVASGHVTFGSFNNTGKLNADVFDVWAKVLQAVPNSRLVLKWRTLVDAPLCQSIYTAFESRGVNANRIELRPASFHVDVLKSYADIDIALDPFPFTGGLTSCEALWMGVPVVTLPQRSVVSRQTFAFLSAMGKTQWVAQDAQSYVKIAQALAADPQALATERATLRHAMGASPLMDVDGFTHTLEQAYHQLHNNLAMQEMNNMSGLKTVLHVGPGHRNSGAKLPEGFSADAWREIRLDIDPSNEPDILGSMLDMSAVEADSVDAIYSAHNIEHVFAHEVPLVLGEFLRVLKPTGLVVITCPDLQAVCALVADNKLTEAAYTSKAGPITPLDILYGHGAAVEAGYHFMAHKTGFTEKSLTQALVTAGFKHVASKRRLHGLDIWAVATKEAISHDALKALAGELLP